MLAGAKEREKIRISYLMFLFVSIYWVYSFYLKDIWFVDLLNEETKKEAPSRFATVFFFSKEAVMDCDATVLSRLCFFFSGSAVLFSVLSIGIFSDEIAG